MYLFSLFSLRTLGSLRCDAVMLCLYVCLWLSISLSLWLSGCLAVCPSLSVHLSASLAVCLSVWLAPVVKEWGVTLVAHVIFRSLG